MVRMLLLLCLCNYNPTLKGGEIKANKTVVHQNTDTIPKAAKALITCYGNAIAGYADNYIIFKDKSKLIWDDGIKNKSFQQILDKPDLKDMFTQHYLKGTPTMHPAKNYDPGRIRNEALFLKIYGNTEQQVRKHLTTINWCPKLVGQQIRVTTVNNIDKKLIQVSKELDEHPELKKYLTNIGGTFAWRNIKGTSRHSMHSFGMTIDINTKYSNYWEWECKCTTEDTAVKYKNKIPQIIIDIFEKYGFIWGGKWYHFDTMHFEYRPELLQQP
ncbi:D-alanyl-D-alanine carboxypeptidase-like protein [Mucilaginibacter gracilis]|uniref:D-alanyl-D-alanine carboxypeptidase-like protein n=1 Tax=Mucilaginibacter gracilis TaxID=423350 RepID=A0A495ITY9_9SPHI|nr:M15 family metallopeptidase [Mucilaginibacter gracilis]RKR80042.1 D-alanyl-D-alanine carboxypeptidase-like protein [Mucilaginibacter gracilis]